MKCQTSNRQQQLSSTFHTCSPCQHCLAAAWRIISEKKLWILQYNIYIGWVRLVSCLYLGLTGLNQKTRSFLQTNFKLTINCQTTHYQLQRVILSTICQPNSKTIVHNNILIKIMDSNNRYKDTSIIHIICANSQPSTCVYVYGIEIYITVPSIGSQE